MLLSCRTELTAYYRNSTFSNSQVTLNSFSERCQTCHIACYPSTTHCNIFQTNKIWVNQSDMPWIILNESFRQLIWYGSQRKTYLNWNFRPLLTFFCNVTTLFSSLALSPTQFTTFFLDGGSYVFRSLIKSTLLAGKDLWSLVDSEFLFSCSTRRLTRERSELSANSWDIELKIMGSSKSRSSLFSYLNVLSTGAFNFSLLFCSPF